MIRLDAFQPSDFAARVAFVEALQEHEREQVPELKPGPEIRKRYAEMLMRVVAERDGCMMRPTPHKARRMVERQQNPSGGGCRAQRPRMGFAWLNPLYSVNTKIIVALLPRLRFSGVVARRPIELRVSPVAMAMYCLPSTA